ncbi:unnamed protein product [Nippostrongylus brasiliensis]|uniref:DUF418 domain-containing protein n=1 Tax=Nippostrongylus brasiliensis TaxID=27835 RepID=A0A0N4YJ86_NIPBR|nr:unnamed protein product [Nippostrongylus brasiliensis]
MVRIRILDAEDPSTLSPSDLRIRRLLSIGYRFAVAVFVTCHLFDFLFSSIWMHGYIWSLNLPIDLDMSDKSAGAIVYHQLEQYLKLYSNLGLSGFASGTPQTVWRLFRLSVLVGLLTGFIRPMQLKQRLFSSLHEGFYCFFLTFAIGVVLTVRPMERLPKQSPAVQPKVTVAENTPNPMEDNNNNNNNNDEKVKTD